MKRIGWAIAFLALLVVLGAAYRAGMLEPARSQTAARPAPAVPVRVAAVVRQPAPVRLDTIGTVQTIANVAVKSRIDAVITDVMIRDGQYVKAGDVLYKLDSRAIEAQLHQAEAQLARDQAQLHFAQHEVKRFAPLAEKNFVSREQLEQAQSNQAALSASVQADQAALENLRVQLSYYTMVAPIDGRVGAIAIKKGNSIKANDAALVTINQIKPIYVGFSLPQANLPEVRAAMAQGPVRVSVKAPGDAGKPETGHIAFFDNAIDTSSGTIGVKATFANDDQGLWPGQFVNVSVLLRTDPDALVVPQAAVQAGQSSAYVYVIKPDNTAELRTVTVARTVDGKSVISKGLKEGERVATDGQLRLTNGTRVEIRSAEAEPKAGARS
jgi:multidrug efflux system membrane fusion protein